MDPLAAPKWSRERVALMNSFRSSSSSSLVSVEQIERREWGLVFVLCYRSANLLLLDLWSLRSAQWRVRLSIEPSKRRIFFFLRRIASRYFLRFRFVAEHRDVFRIVSPAIRGVQFRFPIELVIHQYRVVEFLNV